MFSYTSVNKNSSARKSSSPEKERSYQLNLVRFAVAFVLTVCGILAGYLATIYGIKIDLAQKADAGAVQNLERRVLSLEVYLKEQMLRRTDFYQFRESLQKKLDEIQYNNKP
jgi:hypothetical protein